MIGWLSSLFSRYWLEFLKYGAIVLAVASAVFYVRKSERAVLKVEKLEKDLEHAKEIIRQDRIVRRGSHDIERMQQRLTDAIRSKLDS